MGIDSLGRVDQVKNVGGCGLFRERKKQEGSREFLLLVCSYWILLLVMRPTSQVSLNRFLLLTRCLSSIFPPCLTSPGLVRICLFTCPLRSSSFWVPQHRQGRDTPTAMGTPALPGQPGPGRGNPCGTETAPRRQPQPPRRKRDKSRAEICC